MFEELIRDFNDDVTVEYRKEHKLEQFLLPSMLLKNRFFLSLSYPWQCEEQLKSKNKTNWSIFFSNDRQTE